MSDEDTLTPTPSTRPGTGADLARRMDRMETRQDNMETALHSLSATVARVETNQTHAEELNKLRFDSQKTSIDTMAGKLDAFIARIDGIIDGTVETAQTRQAKEVMAEYRAFVGDTKTRLGNLEDRNLERDAQTGGVVLALSGAKAVALFLLAAAGPVVALIIALLNHQ